MERLAPRDIATLLDYLRELYATRSPDRLAAHLVDTLPRLVASDASSYNEIDVTAGATTLWISRPEVNSVVADGERIFDRHMAEHPVLRYLRMRSEPCVVRLSDTITPDAFHRLGIYEHFYRPARFDHLILCILSPLPAALRGLALCRDGRRDFGGQDLTMLEAVRPHIAQAFRNADVLVRLERHLGNLSLTSEGGDIDAVVVARDGQPIHAPARACARLWRYFGPRVRVHDRVDGLPDVVRDWLVRHMELPLQMDDVPAPVAPLIAEADDRRLVVRLSHSHDDGTALCLVEEQVRRTSLNAVMLRALTARQLEIASLVADGHTNQEIARKLDISPLTARTHLEHIFQRLGIHSRAALARLAAPTISWESMPSPEDFVDYPIRRTA